MWHGCLQAVRSTQTDRRVRKHARRTCLLSAATRSRLSVLTGDQDGIGWQQQMDEWTMFFRYSDQREDEPDCYFTADSSADLAKVA